MKPLILPVVLLLVLGLHLAGRPASTLKKETTDGVVLTELAPGVWLHVTSSDPRYPANGVVAVSDGEVVIIDLPQTEKETQSLFDWVAGKGWKIRYVVPQHWHGDSAGGLSVAIERGFSVAMLDKTAEILSKEEPLSPEIMFEKKLRLKFGKHSIELAHYGGGHTVDSIVAWLPSQKILIGGCLLKSTAFANLGNIADADMDNYLATLQAVKAAYPDAKMVTPGHGEPGGTEVIDHNIMLREKM